LIGLKKAIFFINYIAGTTFLQKESNSNSKAVKRDEFFRIIRRNFKNLKATPS